MTSNSYYGVIDRVEYDKRDKTCDFYLDIYGSQTLRNTENPMMVDRIQFVVHPSEYDAKIGSNGITITQAYEIVAENLTDWESDEV